MKTKLKTVFVELGVLVSLLATLGAGYFAYVMSFDVAKANPEISYMRVPVLILVLAVLACAFFALVAAFVLLERIRRGKVFEVTSVRILQGIGILALAAILPLIILYFYTNANVSGSIANLYVILGCFILLVAAAFLFLIANLFEQAVLYKQENDLTV